jgi:hypothetical protein
MPLIVTLGWHVTIVLVESPDVPLVRPSNCRAFC